MPIVLKTKKNAESSDFRTFRDSVYAKVIRDVRSRSSKEVFKTLVDAGIYTKAGRLTKPYRELQAD